MTKKKKLSKQDIALRVAGILALIIVIVSSFLYVMKDYLPRFYINTSKFNETNVEIGQGEYFDRILNAIYHDQRFEVNSKSTIVNTYHNTNVQNEQFWYYAFDNNDIIRIDENYNFIYYEKCRYWDLCNTTPTIVEFASCYKYHINCNNKWYFVWYTIPKGVKYDDEDMIDESVFLNYKADWINQHEEDPVREFVKKRILVYSYLKIFDEEINKGNINCAGNDYLYIKALYADDIKQEYEEPYKLNRNSLMYYMYYNNGERFEDWVNEVYKGKVGKNSSENTKENTEENNTENETPSNTYIDICANKIKQVEGCEEIVTNYNNIVKVDNNVLVVDADNPSALNTILDEILGIPAYNYSLDKFMMNIYNNYNSNNNITIDNPVVYDDDPKTNNKNDNNNIDQSEPVSNDPNAENQNSDQNGEQNRENTSQNNEGEQTEPNLVNTSDSNSDPNVSNSNLDPNMDPGLKEYIENGEGPISDYGR